MMIFLLLLFFLFGATDCHRPLTAKENQELKRTCGILPGSLMNNNRRSIYGGDAIPGSRAPWSVYLNLGGMRCSGTLISPRHILTATHCFQKNSTSRNPLLKYSKQFCDINDMVYTQSHLKFIVYDSNVHFLSFNVARIALLNMCMVDDCWYDDIAVLELLNDVKYSDAVYPACTPTNTQYEVINKWMEITGFGHNRFPLDEKFDPPVLRHAWMQISNHTDENRRFDGIDRRRKNGLRGGDSGGTAYITTPAKKAFVIGVSNTASPDFTADFASVGYHYHQICLHTGIC